MSDEQEGKIEQTFVKQLGAKYPMAKIAPAATRAYGIRFYPSIYCIAPDGTVHSVPDDRMPSEATIEELLQQVSLTPPTPDEPRYGPLRQMWQKRQHKKLRDYLARMLQQDRLDDAMREVFTAHQSELERRHQRQLERIEKLARGPDYYGALQRLERIADDWKGMPAARRAAEQIARFKRDKAIKKELAASKALAKLLAKYDPSKIVQARKLDEALHKFAKKHDGTYAGEQAARKVGK